MKPNIHEGDLVAKAGAVYEYEEVTGSVSADRVVDLSKSFPNLKKVGGYLDLRGLTSIPAGFNPTVGGDLYLRGLTSIPAGFNPTVGGYLYLRGLTSIPAGFNPTVGGDLYLRGLTSIPAGFNPTVGGYLDLRGLTSIPAGFNPTVGGSLDLSGLTSIPAGFNPTVGGDLYLRGLTSSAKGGDPTAAAKCRAAVMSMFAAAGFSFADGILARIIHRRGNVQRVVICGKTDVSYLVTDGEAYSHGKTLAEARDGLLFKIGKRDPSEFKAWTLDKVVSKRDAIRAYRTITGACEGGVRAWMEQRKTPEKLKVKDIIALTKGAYGAEAFKEFFAGKKEAVKA